jgi:hypothetical protein
MTQKLSKRGRFAKVSGGVMETSIAVFRGKGIRKTIHNNEWWF